MPKEPKPGERNSRFFYNTAANNSQKVQEIAAENLPKNFPFVRRNGEPRFDLMRKYLLERIAEGRPDTLEDDLKDRGINLAILDAWFRSHEQGRPILYKAVLLSRTVNLLAFIENKISKKTIKEVMGNNFSDLLEAFLRAQPEWERFKWYTAERKQLRIEKFKVLLKIDQEFVMNFIEQHKDEPYMTAAVQEEYAEALKTFNTEPPLLAL